MIRMNVKEAVPMVSYIFEVTTQNNIKYITLTDFTTSKDVSEAQFYMNTNEFDGDKKSIMNIMSVLMSYKITADKLSDGFTEFYSDGKFKEFKD